MAEANDPATPREGFFALRLPPFYAADVELWFLRVESVFARAKITDQTERFHQVVGCLDEVVVIRVRAAIRTPSPTTPYDGLKMALQMTFARTALDDATTLLRHPGLGDRPPAEVWQEFVRLAEGHDSALVRRMFMDVLPVDVQNALAPIVLNSSTLEFGKLANDCYQNSRALGRDAAHPTVHQVEESQVNRVEHTAPPRVSQQRTRRPRPPARKNSLGHCYFHDRFGNQAQQCESPCTYQVQGGNRAPKNEFGGRQ